MFSQDHVRERKYVPPISEHYADIPMSDEHNTAADSARRFDQNPDQGRDLASPILEHYVDITMGDQGKNHP